VSAASTSSSSTSSTAATSNQVVSYAADLTVANPTLQLRPGMTATADIVTSEKKNVLLVPNAALRFKPTSGASSDGDGIAGSLTMRRMRRNNQRQATVGYGATQTVYVKGADGQPQPVQVTTGATNGQMTEVLSGGLKPGAQVITGQLASSDGSSSGGGAGRRRGGAGAGGGQRGQ
jgi:HlyD family secretion protein